MALAAAGVTAQTPAVEPPPDTIYYNGHVVTMWADHPVVEAVGGTRYGLGTATMFDVAFSGPLLNCPYQFEPQHHAAPLVSTAQ